MPRQTTPTMAVDRRRLPNTTTQYLSADASGRFSAIERGKEKEEGQLSGSNTNVVGMPRRSATYNGLVLG